MSTKIMYARFEDVQVGDTVRISREFGVDHVQVTTAVVERKTTHQLFSVNNRVLYVEGASKSWGVIDILHRPAPEFPRTVPASEVHEHVCSRVSVEKDGATVSGPLSHAFTSDDGDHWHLYIGDQIIGAQMVTIPSSHPITLEAPASAGASVVEEA